MAEHDDNFYDVVVVGGGPSGLTAAIYLARARYRVLVIEKEKFGGQITITSEVVNYPGVGRTSGEALTEMMFKQGESFGAEYLMAEVKALHLHEDIKRVETSAGEFRCFGVLLATGARPRMVGFKGEKEFRGHGVAYCATCDGEFFTGLDVFVVGGGFAAAEEAVFLTKYAQSVTILVREEDFTCAKATADEARANPKITVYTNTEVNKVGGDSALRFIEYRNNVTGEVTEYRAPEGKSFGVFVFAGYEPANDLVKGLVELDDFGYIVTDRTQKTSLSGVYAGGDVCIKPLRQVVTATGDGALAATELEKYAAEMQKKTGLVPKSPQPHTSLPSASSKESDPSSSSSEDSLLSSEMKEQLKGVFQRMENSLILKLHLNQSEFSSELKGYMEELAALTEKLSLQEELQPSIKAPYVEIYRLDGSYTGLAFHGVPGGHEFTSFVLGLYNAAGPGQSVEESVLKRISSIDRDVNLKILVSLSCTKCPDLVTAAQKIAAESSFVTAEVYDLNHFEDLKDRYNVMSVPCIVINDSQVDFGKKSLSELLDILGV